MAKRAIDDEDMVYEEIGVFSKKRLVEENENTLYEVLIKPISDVSKSGRILQDTNLSLGEEFMKGELGKYYSYGVFSTIDMAKNIMQKLVEIYEKRTGLDGEDENNIIIHAKHITLNDVEEGVIINGYYPLSMDNREFFVSYNVAMLYLLE